MARLVKWLSVKSSADLLLKMTISYVLLLTLVMAVEFSIAPTEARHTFVDMLPRVFVGNVIICGVFLFVVTQQEKLQAELEHAAHVDDLTGIPNRRHFLNSLQMRLDAGEVGHLLLLDADRFKAINDTYGHAAGDSALRQIAGRMQSVADNGDLIGRLGGEEFCVYLRALSERRLGTVGTLLTQPIKVDLHDRDDPVSFELTLSVGVTETAESVPLEKLMYQADVALYEAKCNGRAQMICYQPQFPLAS